MHENNLELLEKAFPKGYAIMYVQPNNDPALHWYNPMKDEFISSYLEMVQSVLILDEDIEEGE